MIFCINVVEQLRFQNQIVCIFHKFNRLFIGERAKDKDDRGKNKNFE